MAVTIGNSSATVNHSEVSLASSTMRNIARDVSPESIVARELNPLAVAALTAIHDANGGPGRRPAKATVVESTLNAMASVNRGLTEPFSRDDLRRMAVVLEEVFGK